MLTSAHVQDVEASRVASKTGISPSGRGSNIKLARSPRNHVWNIICNILGSAVLVLLLTCSRLSLSVRFNSALHVAQYCECHIETWLWRLMQRFYDASIPACELQLLSHGLWFFLCTFSLQPCHFLASLHDCRSSATCACISNCMEMMSFRRRFMQMAMQQQQRRT